MPAVFWLLEAAFRSLLMAAAVWGGIRLLRVRAVQAQKIAWALVLVAAAAMPLAMRSPWLAMGLPGVRAVKLPLRPVSAHAAVLPTIPAAVPAPDPVPVARTASIALTRKPSWAHRMEEASGTPGIVPDFNVASSVSAAPAMTPASIRPIRLPEPAEVKFWSWPRLRSIGLTLYLVVAAVLVLRMLFGLTIALRIWCRAKAYDGAPSARIRVSRELATPVTIGSTVILPADCEDWDGAKMRIVLAHEEAHIRQRDFYLQMLAALHSAVFWFSPLGWWLQRKLSELAEALSDRAGLAESPSPAAYTQILLEFAAQPRYSLFSGLVAGPLTGVPMARTSNLSRRIERILNPYGFRLSDLGSRRHAALAAALVPVALVAVVAGIRIVPAVEAARQTQARAVTRPVAGQVAPSIPDQVTTTDIPQIAAPIPAPVPNPGPATSFGYGTSSGSGLGQAPAPPAPPEGKPETLQGQFGEAAEPALPALPAVAAVQTPVPIPPKSLAWGDSGQEHGDGSFAVIRGKGSNVYMNGHDGKALEEAKRRYRGDFVWFERDGKSYVIDDPAFVAQCESLFREDPALKNRQAELDRMQAKLQAEMANLKPEIDRARLPGPELEAEMAKVQQEIAAMHLEKLPAEFSDEFSAEKQAEFNKRMAEFASEAAKARLSGPEFQAQIAKMQQQIAVVQSDAAKQLSGKIAGQLRESKRLTDESTRQLARQMTEAETEAQIRSAEKTEEQAEQRMEELQERMGDLEGHLGDIQGRLGEIQGEIGERMGAIGEQQGTIGERMGGIGEEMGKIGEQQGKAAEQASRKVRSLIDRAVKDGKAKLIQ